MYKYIIQGLLLGFAYVAPIGTQNIFVINTAIRKSRLRAYQVAFITIFFDISLALSCFLGVGALMERFKLLKILILLLGSVAVIYIGVGLVRQVPEVESGETVDVNKSFIKIVWTCFAVTWLNPQALVDGSLLLGGMRASLPVNMSSYFIIGVCLASFIWFTSLATIISLFKGKFNIKVIKIINLVCGIVIILYGFKLAYSFVKLII
ncbi:LysE family transporter [Clostridium estertheticum]|uniref:LysE/ArgO family amino acid transporter n=1 Tax=Clostridium TaxID=1485 RepID=UPI0013EEAD79|nr:MULTISPECIES: LysE family transporter [Clostridium]MBW9145033.1 LysE family transporter [Clostridium sp. CM027]MBZ9609598.1 LysE family transporter [Clostridium estertheticum]UVE40164.1 LysE family transporter [Clostridium sp. CM027]